MHPRVLDGFESRLATGAGAAASGQPQLQANIGAATGPVRVRTAGDSDGPAWERFVADHPHATVYHRWPWRRVLSEAFAHRPHFLVAERDGLIVGLLPLVQVKTLLFGNALSSLPFCPYAGPLANDDVAMKALDEAASQLARELQVDHLEYRRLPVANEVTRDWPSQDLYVVFRKAITADHDANMNAIPRKQRAMVRKGIKNGLTAETGDLNTFFSLFADNVHRHGTPAHAKRYFALLLEAFGKDADVMVVRAPDGEAVSTVLSLYHRGEALPMHAGDLERSRELAANDFKYWSLMQRAVERGCTTFNYGRSKRGTGPFDFKKNWGFEPTQLAYEYVLVRGKGIPQNNPLNPKYRLMIETWRRLPRPLVNTLGPLLVRGLG